MVDDGRIVLDLGGQGLDPRALSDALLQLDILVKSIDPDARLTLTGLRGGSAHAEMALSGDSGTPLSYGLNELRSGPVLPQGWHRESLRAVAGFERVSSGRGVESVGLRIDSVVLQIDDVIRENARRALDPVEESLGGVRGTIYRYTNDRAKNRRTAGLRRSDTDEAVELRFSVGRAQLVREQLEAEVEVWGVVARDATGQIDHIEVEGIERMEPRQETTAAEGRGILGPDWTGGIDPVEWVRAQRG